MTTSFVQNFFVKPYFPSLTSPSYSGQTTSPYKDLLTLLEGYTAPMPYVKKPSYQKGLYSPAGSSSEEDYTAPAILPPSGYSPPTAYLKPKPYATYGSGDTANLGSLLGTAAGTLGVLGQTGANGLNPLLAVLNALAGVAAPVAANLPGLAGTAIQGAGQVGNALTGLAGLTPAALNTLLGTSGMPKSDVGILPVRNTGTKIAGAIARVQFFNSLSWGLDTA
jgi:hypothetical protein